MTSRPFSRWIITPARFRHDPDYGDFCLEYMCERMSAYRLAILRERVSIHLVEFWKTRHSVGIVLYHRHIIISYLHDIGLILDVIFTLLYELIPLCTHLTCVCVYKNCCVLQNFTAMLQIISTISRSALGVCRGDIQIFCSKQCSTISQRLYYSFYHICILYLT